MTRSYDSPARARKRLATRSALRDTAHRLFVEQGYAATSIATIAAGAGVSVQTVYDLFGSKRELLRVVTREAALGDAATMFDAAWIARVASEPDQRRRWTLLTQATAAVLERAMPMAIVVRAAAGADADARALWVELEDERRADVTALIDLLADAGPLRVDRDRAVDLVWALSRSTDLYATLTVDRGWGSADASAAVSDAVARAIFVDP